MLVLADDLSGLRYAEENVKHRPVADVSALPDHGFGHHAPIWWGNLLMIFIEGAAFAILAASYFYIAMTIANDKGLMQVDGVFASRAIQPRST